MGITLTRSTDICTCARLLPDVYRSLERKSRRERSLCHLQIISMLNCSGNKIPLACVFAAIAIVFIHGLSLAVAPSEPEILEPEARAWATAENEPARPKAGVVFMSYSTDPRIDGHGSGPMMEVVYAGRLLKRIMKPAYPTLLFANKAPRGSLSPPSRHAAHGRVLLPPSSGREGRRRLDDVLVAQA